MNRHQIKQKIFGTNNESQAVANRLCAIVGVGGTAVLLGAAVHVSNTVLSRDCPQIPPYTWERHGMNIDYVSPSFETLLNHQFCVDSVSTARVDGIMPTRDAYAASSHLLNGHFMRQPELRAALDAGRSGDARVRAFDGKNWYDLTTQSAVRSVNSVAPELGRPTSLDSALANPMYR